MKKKNKLYSQTKLYSKLCDTKEMAHMCDLFISDVLRITGLEEDEEGYIVDSEDDPISPRYILLKGKALRHCNQAILHKRDYIFDPYSNPAIMEDLYNQYIQENHPYILSTQVYAAKEGIIPRGDTYGYITVLFKDGSKIQTNNHYKDCTKYLEAIMRLESMTDTMIKDTLDKYDEFEKTLNIENDTILRS